MKKQKKFSIFNFQFSIDQGFTLIELLIVIAILGILAVAVLSAINPLEQIRKANDSRRKSNAAELLNGLERYAVTFDGEYPTDFSGIGSAAPGTQVTASMVSGLGSEMKSEFASRIVNADNYLYVYSESTGLMHVCFEIESEEQQEKYGTTIESSGGDGYLTCLPE